jgi:hypothetical protein
MIEKNNLEEDLVERSNIRMLLVVFLDRFLYSFPHISRAGRSGGCPNL